MKTIELTCGTCGDQFQRRLAEHTRNKKKGRKTYCSLSCSAKQSDNTSRLRELGKRYGRRGSVKDEYSPYREYLRRARRRKHPYTMTLQDLKELWERQDGRCAYTKVELRHAEDGERNFNFMASLDRIDSKLGYAPGNIQFVSATCNTAKNSMTHENFLEFMKLIREN